MARQARRVRRCIGVSGQETAVEPLLTGAENLEMFGRLCHLGRTEARRRASELLDTFGLTEVAGRPAKPYSGGMRRRLDLAISLINSPVVLFLDEPTTGLDPRSRAATWDLVRKLVASGTMLLLTTQVQDVSRCSRDAERRSPVSRRARRRHGGPIRLRQR
ncbi:ATP-binding cassette domain-containing protein [Streptomyces sp. NPDC002643]